MLDYKKISSKIFNFSPSEFDNLAMEIFDYQYQHNAIYRKYVDYLGRKHLVKDIYTIPYLPVEFFKLNTIISDEFKPLNYFESSGTTGTIPSRHYFENLDLYTQSYLSAFTNQYGQASEWVILGLLPSYLEREHASLVNMVNGLMKQSGHIENGFYLYNYEALKSTLDKVSESNKNIILFGVTFALLDFAHQYSGEYPNLTIIETGGMKGRGKEITREELHYILHSRLKPHQIHSEYGMSEMFSQAYSTDNGIFHCSTTMKSLKRNPYDPLEINNTPGRGNINIIDLANLHSCSFIGTMDLGEFYKDGSFKVLGRTDYSDTRGCNLMFS
ncbi:MAG: acyl transferase [Chitinophagales bacterium]|nr:acyl transferase [Chitinophagales bacterium]MCZ2392653.1 acyl transferase [Chitinophagales bacterium]